MKTNNDTTQYYCEKHALLNTEKYLLPTKEIEPTSLKKLKMYDLLKLCLSHSFIIDPISKTPLDELKKPQLVEVAIAFFKEKSLKLVVYKKQKNANETDIISIGKNMKRELDKIPDKEFITNVLIENQISTIAPRMNTIQGMLVQYFIMSVIPLYPSLKIEFVSSSNKLKGFVSPSLPPPTTTTTPTLLLNDDNISTTPKPLLLPHKSTYKEHKKDSIYHCSQFLENNDNLKEWKYVLNTPKKDDYADCFLQGIWFLQSR
jgi:hypothetical protein